MKTSRLISACLAILLAAQPLTALAADVYEEDTAPIYEYDMEVSSTEEEIDQEEALAEDESHPDDSFIMPEPTALSLDASGALTPAGTLDLDAEAVLLYSLDQDTMVYAEQIDQRREPASVTKIMTCLLALEYGALSEEIEVTESALETMDPEGSSAELSPGDVYTLEELLYCLMVVSANDAALVIADYIGGSQEGFVEMMNAKAAALGCTGTHFANPHGMHDEAHYTTARDLARIFSAALEYDLFEQLISTTSYALPTVTEIENEDGEVEWIEDSRTLYSTDYLISTDITDAYFDDRVIGGKTGFTTPAGRCVISLAEVNGLRYLAVVLGGTAWDENDEPYYGSFVTASALLDHAEGFALTAVVPEDAAFTASVRHGVSPARLISNSSVDVLLPETYTPELLTLALPEDLEAPLEADTFAGRLLVYYNGAYLGQTELYTLDNVEYREYAVDPEQQTARHNAMRRILPHRIFGSVFLPV